MLSYSEPLGYRELFEIAHEMTIYYVGNLETKALTPTEFAQKFLRSRDEIFEYLKTEKP